MNKKLIEHLEAAEARLQKMEKMAKGNTLLINEGAGGAGPDLNSEISANEMWDAAHPKVHKSRA